VTDSRRVAIVKSAGRADEFARAVRDAGCVPVLVSPFRDERIEEGERRLADEIAKRPAWVAVTSPNAAPSLEPLRAKLAALRIAAVGPGTASTLHAIGLRPEIVGDAGGEALARRMADAGLRAGDVVVHACAEDARRELAATLAATGAVVVSVPCYRMVPDPVGERAAAGDFAAIVVGSPKLAQRAATLFPSRPPAIAVGRTTAAALRDLGWKPAHVAATPTPEDVAGALRAVLGG
jgi:uroporphyrinogen-III synthase